MKRTLWLAALAVCAVAIPATAGSDFISVEPRMQDSNFVVKFAMGGLAPDSMVTIGLIGRAKAVYGCIAKGSPAGQRAVHLRTKLKENAYQQGAFQASSRGTMEEVIGLSAPVLLESESCDDPNHRAVLVSSEFKNVRLLDITHDETAKIAGNFKKVFFGTR